jgi:molybdopterin converting factor small subunit
MSNPNLSNNKSITIKAFGSLRQHVAPGTTVQNADTVGEAVTQLNLPEMGTELMMVVNGRIAYWQTALDDGDTLQLIAAISGG